MKAGLTLTLVLFSAVSLCAQTDNSELAWQCRNQAHLISLFTVGGRPVNLDPDHKVKILINHGYAVGYSEERRNPLWAVYKASELASGSDPERFERPNFFPRDSRVVPSVDGRTFGNDFDRGHLVPNAVIGTQYGTLAQMETFFMTNMCPQKDDLNQGPWMRLERWIPDLAQAKEHIFVICGPIFGTDPEIVAHGPERGIQIPAAFYMILVDTDYEWNVRPTVRLMAYRFPQTTARSADFFPEYEVLFTNWDDKEAATETQHWTLN